MDYDEVLRQVLDLLQREKRLSYRVLKRRFGFDDGDVEDLKGEAQMLAGCLDEAHAQTA